MSGDIALNKTFYYYHSKILEILSSRGQGNPDSVSSLLTQFPNKEHQVYTQLCKKYDIKPENQPTQSEIAAWAQKSVGKVSNWLVNKDFESFAWQPQFMAMEWETLLTISTEVQLKDLGVPPQHVQSLLTLILKEKRKASDNRTPQRLASSDEMSTSGKSLEESEFKVDENCFTKALGVGEKEGEAKWLNARIMRVNKDGTYDIFVYNAKSHNVPPEAVHVPKHFLRKTSDVIELSVPEWEGDRSDEPKFLEGVRVKISGLQSHKSYNGLCGTVQGKLDNKEDERYWVELDTTEMFAIRPENMIIQDQEVSNSVVMEKSRNAEAFLAGLKRLKNAGFVSKSEEFALSELVDKLLQDVSDIDGNKIGEFAAGYLIAKQKILSESCKKQ